MTKSEALHEIFEIADEALGSVTWLYPNEIVARRLHAALQSIRDIA